MRINEKIARKLSAWGLSAALVLAGAGTISYYEGKSNKAYLDPVSVWTICYGETHNVRIRDVKSDDQCLQSLSNEILKHNSEMVKHITAEISEKEHAAYISFTYNVGVDAFIRSTLLKKLNKGDRRSACDELLRWDKAGGKVLRGLTARRKSERDLCIEGVEEYEKARKELETKTD